METLSLRIPKTLASKLSATARRRGQAKSALVREVLEEYFGRESSSAGAFYDSIADLVGCVEGPPDLSTNPKYLEGYGK